MGIGPPVLSICYHISPWCKFMLTMFPDDNIERYANGNGWIIHRIERTISASKTSHRKQEEWMVCNYQLEEEPTLFD